MTQRRTLQETTTTLAPDDVLEAAKEFFARRNSIYAAFVEREGPSYVALRGQGSEEVIIAARAVGRNTMVTGSTYLFDAQLSRFYALLPPALHEEPSPPAAITPALPEVTAP